MRDRHATNLATELVHSYITADMLKWYKDICNNIFLKYLNTFEDKNYAKFFSAMNVWELLLL